MVCLCVFVWIPVLLGSEEAEIGVCASGSWSVHR